MNIPIAVDPKKKNFSTYKNVTLFKPNIKELREGLKREIDVNELSDIALAADTIHDNQNIRMVLTTLSDQGVFNQL